MLTFKDCITPPNKKDLQKLLNLDVGSIDPAYINHIKKYHGGYPSPEVFDFNRSNKIKESSIVQRFLDITDGDNSIFKYLQIYNERIPHGCIPIAYDPGGNLILMNTGNDKSIYFWDHENEQCYFAYYTFINFLNALHN